MSVEVIEPRFRKGQLVTRTGYDVHRVVEIDSFCFFGEFECLHDESGVYDVGEREGNMGARYQLITSIEHPELTEICVGRGWKNPD